MPGFGNQPIYVDKDISGKILLKKVLGNTPYKLTPGDTYKIIIQMDETLTIPILLDENYRIELPFVGTLNVKGMYFSELRQTIIQKIKSARIVDYVDFFLESPALFEIFIFGGVEHPGFITLTPVNTLWEGIVLAGGFKKGGSYRRISLTRNGQTREYDLSSFVLEGDLTQNPILEPGDKIYIPHADIYTEIKGMVMYPDIYELLPGETLSVIIRRAGGLRPDSDESGIEVARMNSDGSIGLIYMDVKEADGFQLKHGDVVSIRSSFENKPMLVVEGALYGIPTKGTEPQKIPDKLIVFSTPYIKGITLLQLLEKFGGPTPLADAEKSFIRRDSTGTRIDINVKQLWETKNLALDVKLEPRDHIVVPIKPLVVIVAGQVNKSGVFPYQSSAVVSDYIKLAGGIDPEKGDINGIYSVDAKGIRIKITLEDKVEPGYLIWVDKNPWEQTVFAMDQIRIVVAFFAAFASLAASISSIYADIK